MTKQFGGPGSGRHPGGKNELPRFKQSAEQKEAQAATVKANRLTSAAYDLKGMVGRDEEAKANLAARDAHLEAGRLHEAIRPGNFSTEYHNESAQLHQKAYDALSKQASEITFLDERGNPCEPAKAFAVRVEQNGFVAHSFGGPGSGRHPEGGDKEEPQNTTGGARVQKDAGEAAGWKFGNSDQIKGPTGIETRSNFTDKAGNNIRLVSGPMGHFAQVNGRLAGVGWTPSLKQAVKNAQNIL